jgi:hypothetical protein
MQVRVIANLASRLPRLGLRRLAAVQCGTTGAGHVGHVLLVLPSAQRCPHTCLNCVCLQAHLLNDACHRNNLVPYLWSPGPYSTVQHNVF